MTSKKNGNSNNPFEMLNNLGELSDINKFLGNDFFKNLPFLNMQGGSYTNGSASEDDDDEAYPRLDLYNRGSEIVAIFELPGLESSSDVSLQVGPHHLYIKGQASAAINVRHDALVVSECHHGPFERNVELPERVITDQVRASYRSGLLIVYLTKYKTEDASDSSVQIDFG